MLDDKSKVYDGEKFSLGLKVYYDKSNETWVKVLTGHGKTVEYPISEKQAAELVEDWF